MRLARRGGVLALVVAAALSACGGDGGSDTSEADATGPYYGFFYNTATKTGGEVTATLDTTATSVSGPWNFTEGPQVGVLCGAGNLAATRDAGFFDGTFTSNDTDAGCGFDQGAVFALEGTIDSPVSLLSGSYSAKSATGADLPEAVGVFDVWKDKPANQQDCTGTADVPASTTLPALSIPMHMVVVLGEQTVTGQAALQTVDQATGQLVPNCDSTAIVYGRRDNGNTPMELSLYWNERVGDTCPTAGLQLTGSFTLGGNITASSVTATRTSQATRAMSVQLTCTTEPYSED